MNKRFNLQQTEQPQPAPQPSASSLELLHQYPARNRAVFLHSSRGTTLCSLPCFNLLFTLDPNPDLACCCFHPSSVNLLWSSPRSAPAHQHHPALEERCLPAGEDILPAAPQERAVPRSGLCARRSAQRRALQARPALHRQPLMCFLQKKIFFKQLCKHFRTSGQLFELRVAEPGAPQQGLRFLI